MRASRPRTYLGLAFAVSMHVMAAPALAQHELGTRGHFRIGAGLPGHAEERACDQAPGAGWKLRLGSERDTWVEGEIHDTWTAREDGPTNFTQLFVTVPSWSASCDGIIGRAGDGGDTRCTERPYSTCISAGVQAGYGW